MSSPPGPRGLRLLESLLDVRGDRIRLVLQSSQTYGDLAAYRRGYRRILFLLHHPDHARHILRDNPGNYVKGMGLAEAKAVLGEGLLTSEGANWARQRDLANPFFSRRQMDPYASAVAGATECALERWRSSVEAGRPVDVAAEATRLTLDVLGRTLLHADLSGPIADRLSACLAIATRWAVRRATALVRLPAGFPSRSNVRFRRAVRDLEEIVGEIVEKREQRDRTEPPDDDLLSSLLREQDPTEGSEARRRFLGALTTFLLAGHETTAATLAWSCHLLALHPEAQSRVREEACAVLQASRSSFQEVGALAYTRMVVEESLRLFPPVWMIPRRAIAADEIAGYSIPSGSDLLISVYTLHRHPAFWPEPERFDPLRFSPERASERAPYSYLPFGTGPRSCVGSSLGLLEATLSLAIIARRYRLEPVAGERVVPEPLLTLQPKNGLRLRLVPDP
jgi:cytochrome P450